MAQEAVENDTLPGLGVRPAPGITTLVTAVMLVAGFLPLLLTTAMLWSLSSERAYERASENAEVTAASQIAALEYYVHVLAADLRAISQADVLEADNVEAIAQYLLELKESNPRLEDMMVFSANGEVLWSQFTRLPAGVDLTAVPSELVSQSFQWVLGARQNQVYGFFTQLTGADKIFDRTTVGLYLVTPVTDDSNNKVLKGLALRVSADKAAEFVKQLVLSGRGDEAEPFFLRGKNPWARSGTLLEKIQGHPVMTPGLVRQLTELNPDAGPGRVDLEGEEAYVLKSVIDGFQGIEGDLGLSMMSVMRAPEPDSMVMELAYMEAALAGACLLLYLGVLILLLRYWRRATRRVVEACESISSGDYAARIDNADIPADFLPLTRAINAATAEVERSYDNIERILQSMEYTVMILDRDWRVSFFNAQSSALITEDLADGTHLREILARHVNDEVEQDQVLALEPTEACEIHWRLTRGGEEHAVFVERHRLRGSRNILLSFKDATLRTRLEQLQSEFVSTAAHELRTPLTMVSGYAELMLARDDMDQQAQKTMLGTIHRQAAIMRRLVEDFLDMHAIQQGSTLGMEKRVVDLRNIARTIGREYSEIFAERDLRLDIPEDDALMALVDDKRIEQVMENLLSNAFKFSDQGAPVTLTLRREGENVVITVADQGKGMAPEQLKMVFKKFYRVDSSNSAKQGIGLGLSLVQAIVQAHGGSITAESELGAGSKFTVTLPVSMPA